MKKENIIEIQEDIEIIQDDKKIILEKGDKIKVLKEEEYVVYVKGPEIKRWMPMGNEGPVINLMHAIMFNDKKKAEKDAEELKKENPKYDFQVRKKG